MWLVIDGDCCWCSGGVAGRRRTGELLLDGAADAGSTAEPLLHGF
jgi:hypothetical protein